MKPVHLLGISGSLRKQSTNTGLLRYAKEHAPSGVVIKLADIREFPLYNADLQEAPESVQNFFDDLKKADGLLLGCPEYNYSMAPALKNALDWASRAPGDNLLAGKPVAIMGAGGGMGTGRAQYHLRQVCVYLDLYPLNKPEVFSNAFSGGFDTEGNLIDEKIQKLIVEQLTALHSWANSLKVI